MNYCTWYIESSTWNDNYFISQIKCFRSPIMNQISIQDYRSQSRVLCIGGSAVLEVPSWSRAKPRSAR